MPEGLLVVWQPFIRAPQVDVLVAQIVEVILKDKLYRVLAEARIRQGDPLLADGLLERDFSRGVVARIVIPGAGFL